MEAHDEEYLCSFSFWSSRALNLIKVVKHGPQVIFEKLQPESGAVLQNHSAPPKLRNALSEIKDVVHIYRNAHLK